MYFKNICISLPSQNFIQTMQINKIYFLIGNGAWRLFADFKAPTIDVCTKRTFISSFEPNMSTELFPAQIYSSFQYAIGMYLGHKEVSIPKII
jgi:hypothetical protein